MTTQDIVQKLWNLCDVLRDDGINYSDYVTELVLLLFIKMEHENTESGLLQNHKLPSYARWPELRDKSGLNLLRHYRETLLKLSTSEDKLIAAIYADAQTSLKEPRHLEQLVKSLDGIDWFSARQDGLGDLYEGLLEKNASETKSGAGQYFTPRPLIDAIVKVIRPQPGETVQDPAAGTAGFLIAADRYIKDHTNDLYDLPERQIKFQRNQAFLGMELVPGTRRLALMNCLLHGMEGDDEGVVHVGNTLGSAGSALPKSHIILSNPPFGTAKGGGGPTRDDLTFATGNKQLAFLQHIVRHLRDGGRAAVVLPDNVLFEAGVGADIRRALMNKCRLHTLLRLPTGIFYAQGVKTNVLFFQKVSEAATGSTQEVWVYLAQIRSGVDDNEQWRGPYDHLLAKDDYPLFGVHPGNLLPICHTCNSKSKLAKDLLHKNGLRRLSFSPWTESALPAEIQVTIDDTDVFPRVVVELQGGTADRQEKLDTWNEVYKIKERVEGEFLALREKVGEDVIADSEAGFMTGLEQRALAKAAAFRVSPFNFWRARVYRAVRAMDHASREALRLAIQQSAPSAQALEQLFFN